MAVNRWIGLGILVVAFVLAGLGARPYAGGWNDGSRLATVEALVDYHTFAIDQSIFVTSVPYPPDDGALRFGTLDKLYIDGRFYSDKSPVPALLMAGEYWLGKAISGRTARECPQDFVWVLTLASSGLAYAVAVWSIYQLGGVLGLAIRTRVLLTASFGLATVAIVYTRHVNNHVLLLGVAAPLTLLLATLGEGKRSVPLLLGIGTLTGLGYSIDLGVGPVLLFCTFWLVVWRCLRPLPIVLFLLGAIPWVALHHKLNYDIGGTWKPANAVPEYLAWEGSPFNAENMTGNLKGNWAHSVIYSLALLFGKQGFVTHNLPLLLALPGAYLLVRQRVPERPEILHALCWCGGAWLAYGVTSSNYSGQCLTVRWFVPFLAPGYYILAVLLRRFPEYRRDLTLLTFWGTLLMAIAWPDGPWRARMVPLFWPIVAAALLSWLLCRLRARFSVDSTLSTRQQ